MSEHGGREKPKFEFDSMFTWESHSRQDLPLTNPHVYVGGAGAHNNLFLFPLSARATARAEREKETITLPGEGGAFRRMADTESQRCRTMLCPKPLSRLIHSFQ